MLTKGLNRTEEAVTRLLNRHAFYYSNIYQMYNLKSTIQSIQKQYDKIISEILEQIREDSKGARQALLNALSQLETTMNTNSVKQHLNELIEKIDGCLKDIAHLVLLEFVLSATGLFGLIGTIASLFGGSLLFDVTTMGAAAVCSVIASERMFSSKLDELQQKLMNNIQQLELQKTQRLQQLNTYFDGFQERLKHDDSPHLPVGIVWFDKVIRSEENQSFARRLLEEFNSVNTDCCSSTMGTTLSSVFSQILLAI